MPLAKEGLDALTPGSAILSTVADASPSARCPLTLLDAATTLSIMIMILLHGGMVLWFGVAGFYTFEAPLLRVFLC